MDTAKDLPRAPEVFRRPRPKNAPRYTLLKLIGQGGTGAVYKAQDLELDRIIAVKLLHPLLARDELYVNLLKREVVVSSQISHPNVVRVFDIDKLGDSILITMEFIRGENLASVLRRDGALSAPRIVHFSRQICSGLAEAHRRGVVHRDLKPQNLLIDHQSRLFVSDFGLAHASSSAMFDSIGTLIRPGTLRYMSPEQFHALPCDPRSDVFAFGLNLYEMLVGVPLEVNYDSIGPIAIDRATGLPALFPEAVPAPLAQIALRCLAQNPADRYQSASDVLERLPQDLFVINSPVSDETAENHSELEKKNRWYKLWAFPRGPIVALVGLALLTTIGALSIYFYKTSNPMSFDQLYRAANLEMMKDNDAQSMEKAAKLFQSAAALKGTAVVYEGLARSSFRCWQLKSDPQHLAQARSAIQKAEKLNPTSRSIDLLHAEIEIADRQAALAFARLLRVIASQPASDEVLRLLAKAQFLTGHSSEALESLQRAVTLNPNYWVNHRDYGAALMKLGRPEMAEPEFRKVIQLNPDYYLGYANLGAAYVAAGEFQRAIAVTEKSLTMRSTAQQYNNLGTALYYTGTCSSAVQLFRKALELNSQVELYFSNLGEAYRCVGDTQNARAAYATALQLGQDRLRETPNDARLKARMSVYLAKTGRADEAQHLLSSVLAGSSNPEVLYSKALLYLANNQFSQSILAVRAALASGYSIRVAARDPELRPLWVDPDLRRRFRVELDGHPKPSAQLSEW